MGDEGIVEPGRFTLLGIIGGLMLSENLGDVHDEINHLHDLVGIERPQGDFIDGWTEGDWINIGKIGERANNVDDALDRLELFLRPHHSWHHYERELPQGRTCEACEVLATVRSELERLRELEQYRERYQREI